VQDDLSHKRPVTLEAMLKAMLAWMDVTTNMFSGEDEGLLMAKATEDYINLLDNAIEFCNLAQREDSNSQWEKAKNSKGKGPKYYKLRDANICRQIKESLYD